MPYRDGPRTVTEEDLWGCLDDALSSALSDPDSAIVTAWLVAIDAKHHGFKDVLTSAQMLIDDLADGSYLIDWRPSYPQKAADAAMVPEEKK